MPLASDDSVETFRANGSFDSNPTTAVSAEFTPPAGSLIDVSVHAFESLGNHAVSSVVSGGGLDWEVAGENGADFNGGAAGSEGYVAKHWAIADGNPITVSVTVAHQDNSNGYPISAKARVWTGHGVPPMGLTPVSGPITALGAGSQPDGINPVVLPDASVVGRLSFAATEHNDGSGSAGAPSSTDTVEANFEGTLMGTLNGYKAANHAVDDAVAVNLKSVGATKWNVATLEIPELADLPEITGSLALTDGADTVEADGAVLIQGDLAVTDGGDTIEIDVSLGLEDITGAVAVTDGADQVAAAGVVLIHGAVAVTDGGDTVAVHELIPCIELDVDVRNPDLTDIIASAFLDRLGRYAKRPEDVAIVRVFWPDTYCDTSFDFTKVQFDRLPSAKRAVIETAPSAARFIDTTGKSNA